LLSNNQRQLGEKDVLLEVLCQLHVVEAEYGVAVVRNCESTFWGYALVLRYSNKEISGFG